MYIYRWPVRKNNERVIAPETLAEGTPAFGTRYVDREKGLVEVSISAGYLAIGGKEGVEVILSMLEFQELVMKVLDDVTDMRSGK